MLISLIVLVVWTSSVFLCVQGAFVDVDILRGNTFKVYAYEVILIFFNTYILRSYNIWLDEVSACYVGC